MGYCLGICTIQNTNSTHHGMRTIYQFLAFLRQSRKTKYGIMYKLITQLQRRPYILRKCPVRFA